jgi:hypothetical protein
LLARKRPPPGDTAQKHQLLSQGNLTTWCGCIRSFAPQQIPYWLLFDTSCSRWNTYASEETLGEDRSQAHVGSAPRVLAALRDGVLALLRHRGWSSIAEALCYYGASPLRALQLAGRPET